MSLTPRKFGSNPHDSILQGYLTASVKHWPSLADAVAAGMDWSTVFKVIQDIITLMLSGTTSPAAILQALITTYGKDMQAALIALLNALGISVSGAAPA